jgi:hypothetical protein
MVGLVVIRVLVGLIVKLVNLVVDLVLRINEKDILLVDQLKPCVQKRELRIKDHQKGYLGNEE